jgi:hypothetical protein
MLELLDVIVIIAVHFFSDWYMQDRNTAKRKSTDTEALLKHGSIVFVFTCGLFWYLGMDVYYGIAASLTYTVCHLIQDRYIYRNLEPLDFVELIDYKKLWDRIALDQTLHLSQLMFWAAVVPKG